MNKRLDHQLDAVSRTVRQLKAIQVRVDRVVIDPRRPRPVIEIGPGPFEWVCDNFGHDEGGAYWNYSARYNGIELRRQVRDGRCVHAR